jgi:virulence-associated protein VagC
MAKAKTYIANVYTEGKTQIIKLPKAFQLEDGKVYIHKMKDSPNTIEITPKKKTLKEFLESDIKCTDDFFAPERLGSPKDRDYSGW